MILITKSIRLKERKKDAAAAKESEGNKNFINCVFLSNEYKD
jgi:hypothetical protein